LQTGTVVELAPPATPQEEAERKDEADRLADPAQWAFKLREEQEVRLARLLFLLIARADQRRPCLLPQATILRITERKRKKSALGDRKSAAAQSRMKNIADLAADGPAPKKKRKGNDGASDACTDRLVEGFDVDRLPARPAR
jgi:actin-related protein 5